MRAFWAALAMGVAVEAASAQFQEAPRKIDNRVVVRSVKFKFTPSAPSVRPTERVPLPLPTHFEVQYWVIGNANGKLEVRSSNGAMGVLDKADVIPQADAVIYFSDRIAKNPKDAEAHFLRGATLLEARKHADAKKDLDAAVALDPQLAPAWYHRFRATPQGSDQKRAFEDLGQAIRLEPKNARLREIRYQTFRSSAMMREQAEQDLDAIVALAPDYANGWLFRGDHHWPSGVFDKKDRDRAELALADLAQAQRLLPGNTDILDRRVLLLQQLQRKDEAVATLDEAVRNQPNNANVREIRAQYFINVGKNREALAEIDAGLKLTPNSSSLTYRRKVCLEKLGEFAELRTLLEQSLAKRSDRAFHRDLALLLVECPDAKIRDPKLAVVHAKAAIAACFDRETGLAEHVTLAHVYAAQGNYAEAIRTTEAAMADPACSRNLRETMTLRLAEYRKKAK